jgi:hypothetical protein
MALLELFTSGYDVKMLFGVVLEFGRFGVKLDHFEVSFGLLMTPFLSRPFPSFER